MYPTLFGSNGDNVGAFELAQFGMAQIDDRIVNYILKLVYLQ